MSSPKNVGVLTYQRAENHGALLQAYGMKCFLEQQGHNVTLIDYWPDYHASEFSLLPHFQQMDIKAKLKALYWFIRLAPRLLERRKLFKHFMVTKLGLAEQPRYKNPEALDELTFDALVYGSDQLWRRQPFSTFNDYDPVYWGQHPKTGHKMAYAASMGIINPGEGDSQRFKQWLTCFNALSVREDNLRAYLADTLQVSANVVLDPVFLPETSVWNALAGASQLPANLTEQPYVLYYQLMPSVAATRLAETVAAQLGCRLLELQGGVTKYGTGHRSLQTAGPAEFVDLIRKANFVVSTSFHGVAFSLLLQKPFIAAGMGNNAARATTLLSQLDLSERYLNTENTGTIINPKEINHLTTAIDYSTVNARVAILRESSKKFIIGNL
jgi:hypothetical protein